MKRLSGTDALFLSMEMPHWHQHVGGLTVVDPEGRDITFDDVIEKVSSRINYAPKFTWKLKEMPLGLDRPVWVDDPDFDVRHHIRRIGVPAPGGARELGELAGTLMSTQLDRRRPLWEMWFIEGVAGGNLGLLMKYHHCLLDGMAGASLATALMDLEPDATEPLMAPPTPEEATAGPAPSDLSLFAKSLEPDLGQPVRFARYLTGMAAKAVAAADKIRRDGENRAVLRAPKTSFNAPVGPRRELAFASVAMADVQALKAAHGVKVNDVVLALCAGTIRAYLQGHDALPEAPLVTGVPVSTRADGDTTLDNQITTMFASLATDVADPVDRLHAIHSSTTSAKEMTQAIGARKVPSIGEVAPPLVIGAAFRAMYQTGWMSRSPMRVNTLVSNVPGPPVPLYICGGKVAGIFPSSVILENMGLNITVFSYLDRLDIGLHVDPDLVPDAWGLADGVKDALVELLDASGLGAPTPIVEPFAEPALVEPTPLRKAPADRTDEVDSTEHERVPA